MFLANAPQGSLDDNSDGTGQARVETFPGAQFLADFETLLHTDGTPDTSPRGVLELPRSITPSSADNSNDTDFPEQILDLDNNVPQGCAYVPIIAPADPDGTTRWGKYKDGFDEPDEAAFYAHLKEKRARTWKRGAAAWGFFLHLDASVLRYYTTWSSPAEAGKFTEAWKILHELSGRGKSQRNSLKKLLFSISD